MNGNMLRLKMSRAVSTNVVKTSCLKTASEVSVLKSARSNLRRAALFIHCQSYLSQISNTKAL